MLVDVVLLLLLFEPSSCLFWCLAADCSHSGDLLNRLMCGFWLSICCLHSASCEPLAAAAAAACVDVALNPTSCLAGCRHLIENYRGARAADAEASPSRNNRDTCFPSSILLHPDDGNKTLASSLARSLYSVFLQAETLLTAAAAHPQDARSQLSSGQKTNASCNASRFTCCWLGGCCSLCTANGLGARACAHARAGNSTEIRATDKTLEPPTKKELPPAKATPAGQSERHTFEVSLSNGDQMV